MPVLENSRVPPIQRPFFLYCDVIADKPYNKSSKFVLIEIVLFQQLCCCNTPCTLCASWHMYHFLHLSILTIRNCKLVVCDTTYDYYYLLLYVSRLILVSQKGLQPGMKALVIIKKVKKVSQSVENCDKYRI